MSRAEELAQKLADMTSKHKAPSHERGVLNGAVEELRRLAQVEAEHEALKKAISDVVPVAWDVYVAEADNGYLVDSLDDPQLVDDCTNHGAVVTPLYTLEGIRTKP